jgi:predicted Zn finger-like uncharacterized protein
MRENANDKDLTPYSVDGKHIECPHCHFEYKLDDIASTLKNGLFKCPVCGKKFPSSSTDNRKSTSLPNSINKHLVPVLVLLGIVAAVTVIYFITSADKTTTKINAVAPAIMTPDPSPSPDKAISPPIVPASPDNNAPQTALPAPKVPNKMQIVEIIAAKYHASHSYTMEGGFVCLDMAIDVWNQLKTYGIEAKIMGGNIRENITTWNYRQLAMEGNHAWVVAKLSPTEKVAIETTEGKVIKPEAENASVYFKGIEFDTPAQIKRFEFLRRKTYEACRDAHQLIKHWNENIAGKQHKYEETIAKKSQIEQRKQDCENTFNELKEFESKAIYY